MLIGRGERLAAASNPALGKAWTKGWVKSPVAVSILLGLLMNPPDQLWETTNGSGQPSHAARDHVQGNAAMFSAVSLMWCR